MTIKCALYKKISNFLNKICSTSWMISKMRVKIVKIINGFGFAVNITRWHPEIITFIKTAKICNSSSVLHSISIILFYENLFPNKTDSTGTWTKCVFKRITTQHNTHQNILYNIYFVYIQNERSFYWQFYFYFTNLSKYRVIKAIKRVLDSRLAHLYLLYLLLLSTVCKKTIDWFLCSNSDMLNIDTYHVAICCIIIIIISRKFRENNFLANAFLSLMCVLSLFLLSPVYVSINEWRLDAVRVSKYIAVYTT